MVLDYGDDFDPEEYVCQTRFNQRIICPRTGSPVSFGEVGDPEGIPVLYLVPSGCSRWIAIPQDSYAKKHGIRLIAVDRPGMGATPSVPLTDRIQLTCQMLVSVIEHLDVKLSHVMVWSAGIYYAIHLLLHFPNVFATGLNPPPNLWLVAPWSPILPSSHPDHYASGLSFIPGKLIEYQHHVTPHLLPLAIKADNLWDGTTVAFSSGLSFAKSFWSQTPDEDHPQGGNVHVQQDGIPVPDTGHAANTSNLDIVNSVDGDDFEALDEIHCIIGSTISRYLQAENLGGVGQEHLQCLNRGTLDTGHKWFETNFQHLSKAIRDAQGTSGAGVSSEVPVKHLMKVQIWWGLKDMMVPRKGQLWFNRLIESYPNEISVTIHNIKNGDHSDLVGREDGVYQVYSLIAANEASSQSRASEQDPQISPAGAS